MGSEDATTVAGAPPPDPPTEPRAMVGRVFNERYRIERKLAAGSMGVVYEGEQISLGRRVAVKVLAPDRARSDVFRDRFLREARAVAQISHPNIVEILDVGRSDHGQLYMVMEYLEGLDLRHLLHREKQMPWWRARPILVQLASALAAVHGANMIHRDVKPSNCFLTGPTGRETVKLIDFGVIKYGDAKMESRALTQADDVVGTGVYMSPEQCKGEPASVKTDVYSLGVVAYQMVTGKLPFFGRDIFDIMAAHQNMEPPPPRAIVRDLSEAIEQLILKAIAKDPGQRFASMTEFEQALRATSQPLPIGGDDDEFGEDAPTLVREDALGREAVTAPKLPKAPATPIVNLPQTKETPPPSPPSPPAHDSSAGVPHVVQSPMVTARNPVMADVPTAGMTAPMPRYDDAMPPQPPMVESSSTPYAPGGFTSSESYARRDSNVALKILAMFLVGLAAIVIVVVVLLGLQA